VKELSKRRKARESGLRSEGIALRRLALGRVEFKKRLLLVLVVSAVYSVALVIWTLPQWWIRVGTVEPGVAVYKSVSGDVLFILYYDSVRDHYIFYPSTKEIGIPSGTQLHVSPVIVFNNEAPVPVVLSSNRIKVETDMNIVVDDKHIEFTTHQGVRIKAERNWF
jgi:hypothetical protein